MGTEYKNSILTELCNLFKIEKLTLTAHYHQILGAIESSHRTFNEYVRSYISINKDDWNEWLKYFTYCFNTTPSTVHSCCPFELIFGKIPNTFKDFGEIDRVAPLYNVDNYAKEAKYRLEIALKAAKQLLEVNQMKQKNNYDKDLLDYNFKIGALVLLKNDNGHKLEQSYKGN